MTPTEWIKDNKAKTIALALSFLYLAASFFLGGQWDWMKKLLFLILPNACIFLSDAMGGYTGPSGLAKPWITKDTPGCFVAFAGWVLLFFPLAVAIFAVMFRNR